MSKDFRLERRVTPDDVERTKLRAELEKHQNTAIVLAEQLHYHLRENEDYDKLKDENKRLKAELDEAATRAAGGAGCVIVRTEPAVPRTVSMNDTVRFRITEAGWKYIYGQGLCSLYPRDVAGWATTQLWCLMRDFGPGIELGGNALIDQLIFIQRGEKP